MCNNLEIGTRGQDLNKSWIETRKVLITASNMGLVCKEQNQNLINLCVCCVDTGNSLLVLEAYNMVKNMKNRHLRTMQENT